MEQPIVISNHATKLLAAYYTPDHLTSVLAAWAVRSPNATVLDPSFGGCSFLVSSAARLEEIGASAPETHVYGVDVDLSAFSFLGKLRSSGASENQFLHRDFFDVSLSDWPEVGDGFDVILGNPPYIRYHAISEVQLAKIKLELAVQGYELSGRTSLWGYFAVRSLMFLKTGGTMALVLPGAFLHTDYARDVQRILVDAFQNVTCILVRERLFAGTEEESVIFCGTGAGLGHLTTSIYSVETAANVRDILAGSGGVQSISSAQSLNWVPSVIGEEAHSMYLSLAAEPNVVRLGTAVKCGIGVVTGANRHFILSEDTWRQLGLPWDLAKPIIQRANWMKTLEFPASDLLKLKKNKRACLLLDIRPDSEITPNLQDYLGTLEDQGIHARTKCADRNPWYSIPDTRSAPAFFPIMAAGWSRVVMNSSTATCTNNIARLSWKSAAPELTWNQIAVGSLSSLAQLSSEIVGRSYGGGVLKVEPREFGNLVYPVIPVDAVERIENRIDRLLEQGHAAEATRVVDDAMLETCRWTNDTLQLVQYARNRLYERRRGHRGAVHEAQ